MSLRPVGPIERRIHAAFEIGIVLKGLNAALECAGALVLFFLPHAAIVSIATALVHDELIEDPTDFVANALMHAAAGFSVGAQQFAAIYLAIHGIVKIFLVVGLLRDKTWAYPASLIVLGLFILYQLYRMTYAPSWALTALTAFDLVVVWLIWHEYRVRKLTPPAAEGGH